MSQAGPAQGAGPVSFREVRRLALPAMATAVLHNAFRPLDQLWVSWLGSEAQGALGAVTFVMILLYGMFLLISAGAGPLVARATGAGDEERRREVIGTALAACATLAGGVVLAGLLLTGPVVDALGLYGLTASHARAYLQAIALTGAALVFAPTVDACFQAMGDTRTPMLLQLATLAMNILLTPALVYGLGLGVAGAAVGSTLAQTCSVGVGLLWLRRRVGLRRIHLRPSPDLRSLLRIGAPISLTTAMYALVYWAMLATSISPLGPAVNAGLGLGFGVLEALAWPVYLGLSVAVSSIVGRRLGAGEPEQAWRAIRMLLGPVLGVGCAALLAFLWLGEPLLGTLAADEAALHEGVRYARILAWSQPFVALEVFSEGVLAGAGDTRAVLWGTVPLNILRVPLAWALALPLGWGAAGVWWAVNCTSLLKALTKAGLVLSGRWTRLELDPPRPSAQAP